MRTMMLRFFSGDGMFSGTDDTHLKNYAVPQLKL